MTSKDCAGIADWRDLVFFHGDSWREAAPRTGVVMGIPTPLCGEPDTTSMPAERDGGREGPIHGCALSCAARRNAHADVGVRRVQDCGRRTLPPGRLSEVQGPEGRIQEEVKCGRRSATHRLAVGGAQAATGHPGGECLAYLPSTPVLRSSLGGCGPSQQAKTASANCLPWISPTSLPRISSFNPVPGT